MVTEVKVLCSHRTDNDNNNNATSNIIGNNNHDDNDNNDSNDSNNTTTDDMYMISINTPGPTKGLCYPDKFFSSTLFCLAEAGQMLQTMWKKRKHIQ